ncbi:M50 family metallopeptidase [Collinsella tanakaei]|uniref:M50 family metallopeptidase n=1 Tax=Collinsella tanakaei TaxID=626935 RepID=UPI0039F54A3E
MEAISEIIAPVFWGVLLLSVLVFVHEGGHFLAARACGVRVTELFLGMPCRFNVHFSSKRIGTKFGVTPLLIGGYAAICGMDPQTVPCAPAVLAAVHRHGTVSVSDLARELELDPDDVLDACAFLLGWGSIAPVYEDDSKQSSKYYPMTYASMPRDAAGNTVYDGKAFDRTHATKQGDAWASPMGDDEFYRCERSHTYLGKGFWKRALMLVAGIIVNILTGFILMVGVYSIVGIQSVDNVNTIGAVEAGSPAASAGLKAGDAILMVDGESTATWEEVYNALQESGEDGAVDLTVEHDGSQRQMTIELSDQGTLGISASVRTVRLNPLDSMRVGAMYIVQTAQGVIRMLTPQHTVEMLNNSASIVGISVLSAQAAQAGAGTFLSFAALISFSLGFMNLLPIPPLDGGKLLIEIVQAVSRRQVPIKVQAAFSWLGIILFGLLFVYMLRVDILRLL